MVNKDQKKLKKKKVKEQENKKQLLAMRAKSIKARQEENQLRAAQIEFRKARRKEERLNAWANSVMTELPEETKAQIEHNIEILKALELEYENEMDAKRNVVEELEAQGFKTLREKVEALNGQVEAPAIDE